jgi:hypothetical protein
LKASTKYWKSKRNAYKIFTEKTKRREHLVDRGIDGETILK